jgi:hypothetical protein
MEVKGLGIVFDLPTLSFFVFNAEAPGLLPEQSGHSLDFKEQAGRCPAGPD